MYTYMDHLSWIAGGSQADPLPAQIVWQCDVHASIYGMANNLLTINMITMEAIRLWKNTNAFLQNVDTQYDDQFAQTGAKIGASLRIRLPNDFTVRTGPAVQVQDTTEPSTTLTLATQQGVDFSFSSVDRTLSLDDFGKRILAPAINNLTGAVALNIMSGTEGGVARMQPNVDGANNILTPVASTYLQAGALLDVNSAPVGNRKVVNDPFTEARMVASLTGLLNPAPEISKQYTTGRMYDALGFIWMKDQTVLKHTTGALAVGAATVAGAGQTGSNLAVAALPNAIAQGDIITVAGVFAVNRVTKQSTGQLQQFVATAPVAAGAVTIPIYPALIPAVIVNGQVVQVQYQTVTASPANGAAVNPVLNPNVTYRKNFAYVPDAVTLATADLELPKGVHEAAREQFDGVSMRMISAYNITTDQFITRLDVLYGFVWVRPEWAVVIPDAI